MAHLLPNVRQQFLDGNGVPLNGGKLYSYSAGTATPLATYTDSTGGTPNSNPVVFDANGFASVWLASVAYKIVIQDSSGNPISTADGVSQIGPGEVGTTELAAGSVTTAKLATNAVTSVKIASGEVKTVNILDQNVTTAKIADLGVTTAKLAAGAVTQAKRAALGQQTADITSPVGITTALPSVADVTGLSLTITTTGRPVMIMVIPNPSATGGLSQANINIGSSGGTSVATAEIVAVNGSTEIGRSGFGLNGTAVPPNFFWVDVPVAGTYTYKIQAGLTKVSGAGTPSLLFQYCRLMVFEL